MDIVGRTAKPFIEEWVRNLIRKLAVNSGLRLSKAGQVAITAIGGAIDIPVKNPFFNRIVNEMVDEIGPAFAAAAREGRLPTEDEKKDAQERLKDLLERQVVVVKTGGGYRFHETACFSDEVLAGTLVRQADGQDRVRVIRKQYADAIAMKAEPADYCRACASVIEAKKEKIDEMEAPVSKKEELGQAEILRQVHVDTRNRFKDFLYEWRQSEPETADSEIALFMLELDSPDEVRELADSVDLEEFKFTMGNMLAAKSTLALIERKLDVYKAKRRKKRKERESEVQPERRPRKKPNLFSALWRLFS